LVVFKEGYNFYRNIVLGELLADSFERTFMGLKITQCPKDHLYHRFALTFADSTNHVKTNLAATLVRSFDVGANFI